MKKVINKFLKSSIISSVSLIALGILLIFQSEVTIITISYIIGSILIALGVIAAIRFIKHIKDISRSDLDIIYGIVCIILGVVVIENPEAIASVIPFVLGLIIIVNSATKLQYSFELKKEKNDLWLSTLILSIIMVICGIVLIFNPFKGAVLLTRIVGIFILIYSILDLTSTIVINNTFNKIKNSIEESVTEAEVLDEKTNNKKKKEWKK